MTYPRGEQNGLPAVRRISQFSLLDCDDRSAAVYDRLLHREVWSYLLHKDGVDVVKTGLGEEVVVLIIEEQTDLSSLHKSLNVARRVGTGAEYRTAIYSKLESLPHVVGVRGGGAEILVVVKDVIKFLPPKLRNKESILKK